MSSYFFNADYLSMAYTCLPLQLFHLPDPNKSASAFAPESNIGIRDKGKGCAIVCDSDSPLIKRNHLNPAAVRADRFLRLWH